MQQQISQKYTFPHLQETQQNKLPASQLAGHVTLHQINISVVQFPVYFLPQGAILSCVSTDVQKSDAAFCISHYGELDVMAPAVLEPSMCKYNKQEQQ
jgi:hypothetical protein